MIPLAILISGIGDRQLSATVRTNRKLRAAGVVAELHVFEGMSHADYLKGASSPEGREALAEGATFFDRYLEW